jgi:predicted RNA-binding protein with PIN domain
MNWLKKFFSNSKVKELEQEVEDLKSKLEKRQEDINKTNAYGKKKLAGINRQSKN